ncbi:MAG: hypothetical protein SWX82_17380 [Cyanobacteriota bacterium]|nr:hypothetical protein [Cyanobacteriota bacterium]
MKVVVNATPIIALAILQRLELLPQLFEEVFVPPIVFQEVAIQGANQPGRVQLNKAKSNCWNHQSWWKEPRC